MTSEHFSIWSLLNNYQIGKNNNQHNLIDNLVITASGGPFLNTSYKKFNKIKIKNAIKHPNWKMGKKYQLIQLHWLTNFLRSLKLKDYLI